MTVSKNELRQIVAERKKELAETQTLSQAVLERLHELKDFQTASVIMTYVDFGKEVRTVPLISELLSTKRVVIPYCQDEEISLFWLKNLKELAPGAFGILEPKLELRHLSERKVKLEELKFIIVPGTAFDPNGGRVGRGKGYFDRFLKKVPDSVPLVGLAFECQMFPEVPMEPRDKRLTAIVTESRIYCAPESGPSVSTST